MDKLTISRARFAERESDVPKYLQLVSPVAVSEKNFLEQGGAQTAKVLSRSAGGLTLWISFPQLHNSTTLSAALAIVVVICKRRLLQDGKNSSCPGSRTKAFGLQGPPGTPALDYQNLDLGQLDVLFTSLSCTLNRAIPVLMRACD